MESQPTILPVDHLMIMAAQRTPVEMHKMRPLGRTQLTYAACRAFAIVRPAYQ